MVITLPPQGFFPAGVNRDELVGQALNERLQCLEQGTLGHIALAALIQQARRAFVRLNQGFTGQWCRHHGVILKLADVLGVTGAMRDWKIGSNRVAERVIVGGIPLAKRIDIHVEEVLPEALGVDYQIVFELLESFAEILVAVLAIQGSRCLDNSVQGFIG